MVASSMLFPLFLGFCTLSTAPVAAKIRDNANNGPLQQAEGSLFLKKRQVQSTSNVPSKVISTCKRPGLIALAIENGPTANMAKLSAELSKVEGAKATFFVHSWPVKPLAKKQAAEKLIKDAVSAGMEVGNHGKAANSVGVTEKAINGLKDELSALGATSQFYLHPMALPRGKSLSSLLGVVGKAGYPYLVSAAVDLKAITSSSLAMKKVRDHIKANKGKSVIIRFAESSSKGVAFLKALLNDKDINESYAFVTLKDCIGPEIKEPKPQLQVIQNPVDLPPPSDTVRIVKIGEKTVIDISLYRPDGLSLFDGELTAGQKFCTERRLIGTSFFATQFVKEGDKPYIEAVQLGLDLIYPLNNGKSGFNSVYSIKLIYDTNVGVMTPVKAEITGLKAGHAQIHYVLHAPFDFPIIGQDVPLNELAARVRGGKLKSYDIYVTA